MRGSGRRKVEAEVPFSQPHMQLRHWQLSTLTVVLLAEWTEQVASPHHDQADKGLDDNFTRLGTLGEQWHFVLPRKCMQAFYVCSETEPCFLHGDR